MVKRSEGQESELCIRVGQNIRAARERIGITQTDLAKMIGSTQSQIGKYERGVQDMSLTRLIQISEALGVVTSDLFR